MHDFISTGLILIALQYLIKSSTYKFFETEVMHLINFILKVLKNFSAVTDFP